MIPLTALQFLRYSQQWQASDLFRAAPIPGPSPLSTGAGRAVFCFLTLPLFLLCALIARLLLKDTTQLALLLPGLIALPVYSLIPSLGGKGVPLSHPTEEAKAAGRGASMILVMLASMGLAGIAVMAWSQNWFLWLLAGEAVVIAVLCVAMHHSASRSRWESME